MIQTRRSTLGVLAILVGISFTGIARGEAARLENGSLELGFESAGGTLDALVYKAPAFNLLSAPAALWRIALADGGSITPGQAKHFGMEGGETSASRTLTWDDFGLADAPALF